MRNKDLYFCIWGDVGWYHVPISYRIGLPFLSMLLVWRKECEVIRQQKWHPSLHPHNRSQLLQRPWSPGFDLVTSTSNSFHRPYPFDTKKSIIGTRVSPCAELMTAFGSELSYIPVNERYINWSQYRWSGFNRSGRFQTHSVKLRDRNDSTSKSTPYSHWRWPGAMRGLVEHDRCHVYMPLIPLGLSGLRSRAHNQRETIPMSSEFIGFLTHGSHKTNFNSSLDRCSMHRPREYRGAQSTSFSNGPSLFVCADGPYLARP